MIILFIQLPLLDHSRGYLQGNMEYGPAAMAGYLRRHFGKDICAELLPPVIAAFGSDLLIMKYVRSLRPDAVAFTCYLWNAERSLELAREIKESLGSAILMGGPEVEAGSFLFAEKRPWVDFFVSGEGEWFFRNYCAGGDLSPCTQKVNGNRFVSQPPQELLAADEIVEPYTNRMIGAGLDGTAFMELARGCPHRCTYCFYSKRARVVRELPFDILIGAIKEARGLKEMYILAPTFNSSKRFIERLRQLASLEHNVALHTEMRARGIDDDTARLMHRAGFRSLEVGLQTMTPEALHSSGRTGDPEDELRGMEALKRAGVALKIGVIPGLPGDTPDGFIRTVDLLMERGFADEIELYPLLVLPGTEIRECAVRRNYRFQELPPYYFLSGGAFAPEDMEGIIRYVESSTGYSASLPALPDFTEGKGGLFIKGVRISGNVGEAWDGRRYRGIIETSLFTFHVHDAAPGDIYRGLPHLLAGLPGSLLFFLVLYLDEHLDEERLDRILSAAVEDTLYGRSHCRSSRAEGLRWRLYQVFTDFRTAAAAHERYRLVEPILRLGDRSLAPVMERGGSTLNLLVPAGETAETIRLCAKRGEDYHEATVFEHEADEELFYREAGRDYVNLPFSFRIADQRS